MISNAREVPAKVFSSGLLAMGFVAAEVHDQG